MESELWPNLIMSATAKGVSIFLVNLKHDEISVHHHAHFLISRIWTLFFDFPYRKSGPFVWAIQSVSIML
jgi:3-deoxy-D-manno-octulosonic-acid transferase